MDSPGFQILKRFAWFAMCATIFVGSLLTLVALGGMELTAVVRFPLGIIGLLSFGAAFKAFDKKAPSLPVFAWFRKNRKAAVPTAPSPRIAHGTPGAERKIKNVTYLDGPSPFWRCPKCRGVLEKNALGMDIRGPKRGRVTCQCGSAYPAEDVYGGKYDLQQVEFRCPLCSAQLRGPAEELLGKPCPACNRQHNIA